MREPQPTSDVEDAAALASMSHADRYRAVEPAAQELHDRRRDRLTTEEVNLGFVVGRDHRASSPGTRLTVGEGLYGSSVSAPRPATWSRLRVTRTKPWTRAVAARPVSSTSSRSRRGARPRAPRPPGRREGGARRTPRRPRSPAPRSD